MAVRDGAGSLRQDVSIRFSLCSSQSAVLHGSRLYCTAPRALLQQFGLSTAAVVLPTGW